MSEPAVLRLILEMAAGAIVYIGTVFLLHRERAMSFLQIAKRMRGKKAR
jgi:hypothetical protein